MDFIFLFPASQSVWYLQCSYHKCTVYAMHIGLDCKLHETVVYIFDYSMYLQCLEESMVFINTSINIYWMNVCMHVIKLISSCFSFLVHGATFPFRDFATWFWLHWIKKLIFAVCSKCGQLKVAWSIEDIAQIMN